MRKDRFLDAYAEHLPFLRNVARKAGLDYDEANEVLGECFEKMLEHRKYIIIESDKLKTFLHARIRFEVQHFKRREVNRKSDCARLPDPDFTHTADSKVDVTTIFDVEEREECPFCFKANLNEYGACAMCHTIVPSYRVVHREIVMITEESLAVTFDFNTKLDIQNAVAQLTPYEQQLVTAIGMGNESLESFGEFTDKHHTTILRDWAKVKVKLQELLNEYAPEGHPSCRGTNAFRKAIEYVTKTTNCESH